MKQTKKRTQYTAEYKAQAVKLITEQQLNISEAAQRLGMPSKH